MFCKAGSGSLDAGPREPNKMVLCSGSLLKLLLSCVSLGLSPDFVFHHSVYSTGFKVFYCIFPCFTSRLYLDYSFFCQFRFWKRGTRYLCKKSWNKIMSVFR